MVAWRATGSAAIQFGGTTLAVSEPASSSDGELMVVWGYAGDATGFALAGWTVVISPVIVGGVDYDLVIAYRIRSGSANGTFAWTNSSYTHLVMAAFDGGHASAPVESVTAGAAAAAAGKVAPDVSSTYDNSLLADFAIEDSFSTWSPDAAFTERHDGGAADGMALFTLQLSASGSTGTHTHTSGGSNGGIVVRMVIVDDVPTSGEATIKRYSLTLSGVG